MPKPHLVLIDPGHFHAALVQKEMYPGLSPEAYVYAPLGPELIDYLGRIARFNAQSEAPTRWQLQVQAAPDSGTAGPRTARRHRGHCRP